MKIEDEVLEKLRHLPDEKKADVLRYVERVEAALARERLPGTVSDRAAASMRWIDAHRAEYAGQWVAMDGDRLVAHGVDARAVADEVRRLGLQIPFLHRVGEAGEGEIWGAWL
jgi:hypothetical protein